MYCMKWFLDYQVGGGSGSPYTDPETTATYVTNWIVGAKKFYNLTIDYVGVSELFQSERKTQFVY